MKKFIPCLAILLSLAAPALAQSGTLTRESSPDTLPPQVLHQPCLAPCGPWDTRTAAHLMRRAGFSASPQELERLVAQGFEATLDELLNWEAVDDSQMEQGLEAKNYPLVYRDPDQNLLFADGLGLRRWWLYRMAFSRRQLLEKMTYFWHDHFATSIDKVSFVGADYEPLMLRQNRLLRRNALGNFRQMVREMARDPAMLIWLDNASNVADHPNENWARELLELFTLGIGNYQEKDIREAARAFTGWSLDRETLDFRFYPIAHDFGEKTFLGVTGPLDGDDIVDIVFQQPAAARFIARKLFEFFVYPDPDDKMVEELAQVFRENDYELRPLMRAIFSSPEFYSERAYRAQIKSPLELAVGSFREFELSDPDFLPFLMRLIGQNLFAPPDVGGWTSGVGWINTSTLLTRYNFFNLLTTQRQQRSGARGALFVDVDRIIKENHLGTSWDLVYYFTNRLLQGDVSQDTLYTLEEYLRTGEGGVVFEDFDITDPVIVDKKVRGLIYLVLTLPAYELN